jgi:glycine dehydrogenase
MKEQIARSFIGAGYSIALRRRRQNIPKIRAGTPLTRLIRQKSHKAGSTLLNFQQMITDLTGDIANASLLDEATAAAEAMSLCHAVAPNRKTFFVADNCHPQTIGVIQTRAKPLGIEIKIDNYSRFKFDDTVFGALVQYPATDGAIYDYADFVRQAHEAGALIVVAADILALTFLKPRWNWAPTLRIGNTRNV